MSGFTAGTLSCARSCSHEGCAVGLVGGLSDWQFWTVSGTESRERETAKGQMVYSAQSDGAQTCCGRACTGKEKRKERKKLCFYVREEEMEKSCKSVCE